jgi:hypothetical protein
MPTVPVTVQQRPQGSAKQAGSGKEAWTDIAVLTPGADGSFAFTARPLTGVYYRATTADGQVTSAQATVDVMPRVTMHVTPHFARTDGKVTVSGRIVPPSAATELFLDRNDPKNKSKNFTTVAHAQVQPDGTVTMTWQPVDGLSELRLEAKRPTLLNTFAGTYSLPVMVKAVNPPETLSLKAVPAGPLRRGKRAVRFSVRHLAAKPSTVTILMKNLDTARHNVAIKGAKVNVKGAAVGKGGTSRVTATLPAGSYQIYSSIASDARRGLRALLVVH